MTAKDIQKHNDRPTIATPMATMRMGDLLPSSKYTSIISTKAMISPFSASNRPISKNDSLSSCFKITGSVVKY